VFVQLRRDVAAAYRRAAARAEGAIWANLSSYVG